MKRAWIGGLALLLWTDWKSVHGGDDDLAGERGRAELAALVKRAFEGQAAPRTGSLQDREHVFGLAFTVVEGAGLRVLSAEGEEREARRVAGAMCAARTAFVELTGAAAFYPASLSAYLLGSNEAKAAFLLKHPKLGPEASARMAKLEGSGVADSADWAWWEGDAEKRLDGMVRFSFDWLCRTQRVTLERHAWLHEGLGFYLTHALVGTHLTWFVQPRAGASKRSAANIALRSQMDEPGADWMALARGLFDAQQGFDLEELLHLEVSELEALDHLRAHALAGYLVEVQRPALGAVLTRVGGGDDPRVVLEEVLGFSLDELRTRLDGWLAHRDGLVAKAEGRRTEAELRAQWQGLDPDQRRAAMAAFRRRVGELDTQQLRLLRTALAGAPAELPPAEEAPFYDPKVHAPGQIIARKRLSAGDARVKRLLLEFRPAGDPPALAFDYDWARARVVRGGDPDEPERVFQDALRGVPPGADLVRALVLAGFDRPDERKLQAAFAHAYTDRDGNVYPLTLFEMLSTGALIERPDVDTLGIVHDVLGEWKRWVAPVPATQHDAFYKVINELFTTCKNSRVLRLSLAELFLAPGMTPQAGYETLTFNLQALWASVESEPGKLAALLPEGKLRDGFLTELVSRCQQDYKFYALGRRRAAQFRRDGEALRVVLAAALDEGQAAPRPAQGVPLGGR